MPDYRNIKVSPDTFETLAAQKPSGVTWDYYLSKLAEKIND